MKPRLLDLYSCAGGAGVGYFRAGFDVVGVDISPQPRYPFEHHVADALEFLAEHGHEFDAVHASPPYQRYSDLARRNANADDWPDLVDATREALTVWAELRGQQGLPAPWVIENVEGAPLRDPVWLCGTQFPGLRVLRHRGFESNVPIPALPHGRHPLVFTHDKRKAHYGRLDQNTAFVQVTGGGNATLANKRAAMGTPWMTNHEVNEAVPPQYTEHVGRALMHALERAGVAA